MEQPEAQTTDVYLDMMRDLLDHLGKACELADVLAIDGVTSTHTRMLGELEDIYQVVFDKIERG